MFRKINCFSRHCSCASLFFACSLVYQASEPCLSLVLLDRRVTQCDSCQDPTEVKTGFGKDKVLPLVGLELAQFTQLKRHTRFQLSKSS